MLAVSIKVKSVKAGRVIISEDARDRNFTYEGETITTNVKALAMWWHFLFVSPQPMLIKELM